MHGRIALLHAAIVARTDQLACLVENRSADWNAAFGKSNLGLFPCDLQHCAIIVLLVHGIP